MQASVVISYYKNIANLEILLLALKNQSSKNTFEVIISEDDDALETKNFISQQQPLLPFSLIHVSQSDEGFRKCRALNRAIAASSTDFILFLDGDCIPHKHFVKQYLLAKKPGRVLYGRRVMLSDRFSSILFKNKNFAEITNLNLLLKGCKRVEEGLYLPFVPQRFKQKNKGRLLGCNMGIFKKDLLSINGFDEDYVVARNGEDSDIEWRLEALKSLTFYSMKFSAIVYHLYHVERNTPEIDQKNNVILENKIIQNNFFCINGIQKIITSL